MSINFYPGKVNVVLKYDDNTEIVAEAASFEHDDSDRSIVAKMIGKRPLFLPEPIRDRRPRPDEVRALVATAGVARFLTMAGPLLFPTVVSVNVVPDRALVGHAMIANRDGVLSSDITFEMNGSNQPGERWQPIGQDGALLELS